MRWSGGSATQIGLDDAAAAAVTALKAVGHVHADGPCVGAEGDGILNEVVLRARNSAAESINARIHRIKAMVCGYRNRERFRFHLGGFISTRGPLQPTRIHEAPFLAAERRELQRDGAGRHK